MKNASGEGFLTAKEKSLLHPTSSGFDSRYPLHIIEIHAPSIEIYILFLSNLFPPEPEKVVSGLSVAVVA